MRTILYKLVDLLRWPELAKLRDNYKAVQSERFEKFCRAVEEIPYYASRSIDGNTGIDSYILTKKELRESYEALRNPHYKGKFRKNTSGGSTGEPAIFLQDAAYDRYVSLAMRYYYENIMGIDIRPLKKVIIWGSEADLQHWNFGLKARMKAKLFNAKYFNAFNLTEDVLAEIVAYIRNHDIRFVRGYASSLKAISSYILKKGYGTLQVDYVVSSAEKISVEDRQLIARAFRGTVYDIYGSREAGMIAGSCKNGNYHVMTFNHQITLGQPIEGLRPIYVSTLNNRVMPLVNYRIGDMAESGLFQCECGSELPALKGIAGRISDNFWRSDGSCIHGEFFTHLLYFDNRIRRFQFVQSAVEQIELRVEPAEFITDADSLGQELVTRLKPSIDMAMRAPTGLSVTVGDVSATAHGKQLYTISKVNYHEF